MENSYDLIKNLESCDLRDLKNNYFTEENPERFTHWELTYNNYFKIVEELNEAITNEKCTWQNIFRILKVNKPEDLFKIMFEKIDYFVKNETLKLKQSR